MYDVIYDLTITKEQRLGLAKQFAGVLIKMVYAFVWQETTIPGPWLTSSVANYTGGLAMKYVNKFADSLTGYHHPDPTVAASLNVYPGDTTCRTGSSPHAKWHEQSANALFDLIQLCGSMKMLIKAILPTRRYKQNREQYFF